MLAMSQRGDLEVGKDSKGRKMDRFDDCAKRPTRGGSVPAAARRVCHDTPAPRHVARTTRATGASASCRTRRRGSIAIWEPPGLALS
jgi:hypothetical protein